MAAAEQLNLPLVTWDQEQQVRAGEFVRSRRRGGGTERLDGSVRPALQGRLDYVPTRSGAARSRRYAIVDR